MSWFDKLPPILRHGLIAFTSAILGDLGSAVVTAGGVQALVWPDAGYHALTAGVVAVVGALGLLSGTSLTRQYGLGSKLAPVSLQPSIAPAPDGDTSPGMGGNL
jgi:hypothetical protein